ncbi:hypothetical protein [Actinomadura sp. DC4]|uniref:hypothetical protein n=1 Tax=Actinomadura sp. DC4 TaxID=3055069 RepID=UPI0025B08E8C|nr:hypothetical protein [Actinomadura sp. DC4]MDN3354097.1 hypothetical protein [Actinomadura sp. DC4]
MRRVVAGTGVAVLAFGLVACKGSSDKAGPAPSETTADAAPAGSAGLTPPGTHLRLGQAATVGWVPAGGSLETAQKGFKLQVNVLSITKGTIGDFKNVQLKPEERKSTPYYVKVRIKTLSSTAPTGTNNDPDVTLDAIDDRGQQQNNIIFMGTFTRCDDITPPKPFKNGKSYSSCLAYLMPGGGSIRQVVWKNGPNKANKVTPYFEKPIVWAGA